MQEQPPDRHRAGQANGTQDGLEPVSAWASLSFGDDQSQLGLTGETVRSQLGGACHFLARMT